MTLAVGLPSQNLNIFFENTSNVLTDLGHLGFPDFDAIGEGAFSVLFSSGQSQFGFELVGGNGGNAHVDFYAADGGLIDSITLSSLSDTFYGFSRDGGVEDIRGISIWNDDLAGIGFDNLKHDVVSDVMPSVPEASTWTMLLLSFAGIGLLAYRRQSTPARMAS